MRCNLLTLSRNFAFLSYLIFYQCFWYKTVSAHLPLRKRVLWTFEVSRTNAKSKSQENDHFQEYKIAPLTCFPDTKFKRCDPMQSTFASFPDLTHVSIINSSSLSHITSRIRAAMGNVWPNLLVYVPLDMLLRRLLKNSKKCLFIFLVFGGATTAADT